MDSSSPVYTLSTHPLSTRAEGRILDVNERFAQLIGYDRAEVIGQTAMDLGLWGDAEQRTALLSALEAGQPIREFAATLRTRGGGDVQVRAAITEVEIDGRPCLLSQLCEVTACRQAERRFRALVEHLPVITYIHELDDPLTMTYISPQAEAILGYAPTEVLAGQPDFMMARTHPEDRAGVREAVAATLRSAIPFRAEYRLQASDGRWLWVRDEATIVRDEAGVPLYWQGVIADITEQQRVAEERDRAERRFRELFEDAPVMYVITRSDAGRPIIEDCNTPFLTALGYERDEVLGRPVADFYTPASREALLAGGYQAALAGQVPASERQLVTRTGEVLDVLLWHGQRRAARTARARA